MNVQIVPPAGRLLAPGHFSTGSTIAGVPDATKPVVSLVTAGQSGRFEGELDIVDLAWDATGHITRFDVLMTGVGEIRWNEPEPPGVTIGAHAFTFPRTPLGLAPIYQREWLHNTSGAAISIGAIGVSGSAAGDFAVSGDSCGNRALAAGASCSFLVGYSAKAVGPRIAALAIPIGGAVRSVALSGTTLLGTNSLVFDGYPWVTGGVKNVDTAGPFDMHVWPRPAYFEWQITKPYGVGGTVADLALVSADGGPLQPGQHTTVGVTDGGHGQYGASISATGHGCGTYRGTVNVHAFAPDRNGMPSIADVDFTIVCDDDDANPVVGTLLWQSRSDVTPPPAPTGVTVSGMTATWTPPASTDAVRTIARLVAGDGSNATPTSGWPLADGTGRQAQLPSAGAGRYTVAVFAVDAAGNVSGAGAVPYTVGSTAPTVTVPTAPIITKVIAGDRSVTVTFTPPASDGGSPITGYQLRATSLPTPVTGGGSPLTMTGLTNGAPYVFQLVAVSAAGTGQPAVTGTVVPQAPTAPPPAAKELLPDPGFEAGTGGWKAFVTGTLTTVASPVHSGSAALKVAAPNTSPGTLVGLTQNTVVSSTVAGAVYTASCWVRPISAGLGVRAEFLEYTQNFSSNLHMPMTTVASLAAGTWTQVTWSGTAVRSGERMIPQIYSVNQTAATGAILYDDCSVTVR
ncbi:fibronectin type III domain-containing protein [Leifsonia sp. NPDC014704]|uniref:fibronectin type III domain-containing protein n=1 Tax=Leifsonia sp. NPDC014704 TaxID=3364123 RepID=UPI0036F48119